MIEGTQKTRPEGEAGGHGVGRGLAQRAWKTIRELKYISLYRLRHILSIGY
jgi:hypothetical protein